MNRSALAIASIWLIVLAGEAAASESVLITVDTTERGPAVNPHMYGIFLEEINHGVDGGLYAELIRNRAFEDSKAPEGYFFRDGRWRDEHGFPAGFERYGYTTNGVPFWSLITDGAAMGSMHLQTSGGITEQSAYCLQISIDSVDGGRVGVANEGYFGIGVREDEEYSLSLYARCSDAFDGPLSVGLETEAGNPCSTMAKITGVGSEWTQFKGTLKASRTERKARLVITANSKGTIWLDFVSLFPKKTWKGRPNGLRRDIAQMISDLSPGFVRFPGGCVVEGGTIETAYNWKLTVGPLEEREERWGPWNYRETHGMGLQEYLQFCEDLDAEPLWVGFVGQTCIFREREQVSMEDMGWVRDNFLDLVEYANGPVDSKWGKLRARAGHRDPFGLKYVEIGNENQGREYGERYRFVHSALKEKYPDLKYLADLSWTSRESLGDAQFDVEDRHYYSSPVWFRSRYNEYDERDRNLPPLYLGEVAVTSNDAGRSRGNLLAALAEGVFLLGCERNADTVKMVSYAPLLGNVDGRTELTDAPPPWHAMIYFDENRVFGTASYYLWKLFGNNRPDEIANTALTFPNATPSVVRGQIGVGTWNTSAEFKDIRVEQGGKVLYQSNFTNGSGDWKPERGRWTVEDGLYRQNRPGQGFSYFGDPEWSDYTLTLKARKLAGGEGFLILFGRKGTDRYWWNLGGWGNREHGIEFNQMPVGQRVRGEIQTDHWYDIKVQLQGRRIRCYLDDELVHDAIAPEAQNFYADAGLENSSGDLIVKAINFGEMPIQAKLNLRGFSARRGGTITVLTSRNLSDNNSLDEPTKVVPTQRSIAYVGNEIIHEFPPISLSVLRLSTRPEASVH